jgi:predicted porin
MSNAISKTSIATAALLATLGATSAMAQSTVTIYGRINTTVESQKDVSSTERQMVMANNSSRWGLKGTEDLGGGLKASFLLESGFGSDTGAGTPGSGFQRESWVGLEGGFGKLRLGNMGATAAYYASADYISMHNHDTGSSSDMFYLYPGAVTNMIAYTSPTFGGFVVDAQLALKESTAAGAKNTFVLAGNYDAGPLHLGAGYVSGPVTLNGTAFQDAEEYSLRGLYELGAFTVGAYFAHNNGTVAGVDTERNTYRVSGMYTMGNSEFHANFGVAGKVKVGGTTVADSNATQFTLGYNYNLSKRTKVYGYYTAISNKAAAGYNAVAVGEDPSIFAVGIRHNF